MKAGSKGSGSCEWEGLGEGIGLGIYARVEAGG